ncbi:MAG: hypothetical protein ABJG47_20365 [Ekhidna sp.]
MIEWQKKGLLIEPQKHLWWMQTHAMLPTVIPLSGNEFRVYFSGRDESQRSQIGYADIEVSNGQISVLNYSKDPVLSPGERGCFDDNGVTPSWVVQTEDTLRLYYIGWNSGTTTTRMSLIAGLANSADGKSFKRYSRAPLLDRTNAEPFGILTAPCVLLDLDNKLWEMWYVSGEGWRNKDLPIYNIKYAHSSDGINWIREGTVCIDFNSARETALARPCVLKSEDGYRMWFSYKDPAIGYRIGFAASKNGKDWKRQDALGGLDVGSKGDWDSEMIQYSYIFFHEGIYYLLYNGNGYGLTGIGYGVSHEIPSI